MQACPPSDRLRQLLAENLGDRERTTLTAHVESCARCQRLLDELTTCPDAPRLPETVIVESNKQFSEESHAFLHRLKTADPSSIVPNERALGQQATLSTTGLPDIPGYVLLELLGRGGAGSVYRARDTRLNRFVALKLFAGLLPAETKQRARIRKEAEAAARLQHPNIVQIYEIGESAGHYYLVLELVHGPTLAECFETAPLPPLQAASLLETLAQAVQHAHERGIIHRDLKPANILMKSGEWQSGEWKRDAPAKHDETGPAASPPPPVPTAFSLRTPKITDFGMAKRLNDELGHTGTGAIMGTPGYMSPEQASGRSQEVGPATDVHALGAILYEALTGRPPFRGALVVETLDQIRHEEPVPPARLQAGIPPDLQTITLKCLQKEPWRRYATAQELADDLHRFLAHEPIRARPPSLWYQTTKFVRRNKGLVGSGAAILLSIIAGALVAIVLAIGQARQRHLAETSALQAQAIALQAESDRQTALREAYQAHLAAALLSLNEHNLSEAGDHLQAAPRELRGWEWQHLDSRLQEESPETLPCAEICHIFQDFFPPGQRLVGVSLQRHSVVIVDAHTGALFREFAGYEYPLVQRTSAGLVLVLIKTDGTVALVNEAGDLKWTGTHLPANFGSRSLSPDGRLLAVAWDGKTNRPLAILDLASGQERLKLPYADRIMALAFSPDGGLLAGACYDGCVRLWDTTTGAIRFVLRGHGEIVFCVAFSPDGSQLASGSGNGVVCQWDPHTGACLALYRSRGDIAYTVAYSADSQWLAAGSWDRRVRLWRAQNREATAVTVLHPHAAALTKVGFSPDGHFLASISADVYSRVPGSVGYLWPTPELENVRLLRGHARYVYPVAYSPDGRWIASGGWDNVVRLWDAASGLPITQLKASDSMVYALAISPDSTRLVACSADNAVRVWDMTTGRLLFTRHMNAVLDAGTPQNVAISPDGATIAIGFQNRIHFWDLATGTREADIPAPVIGMVRLVQYTPDGTHLAVVVAQTRKIFLLELASGQVTSVLGGHTGEIYSISFNADGSKLVSAGDDRTVRVWDVAGAKELGAPLLGHTDEIFSAIFLPGDTRIASGGRDQVIRLWDPAAGTEVARLSGHTDYIFSLAVSPDGSTLVSGSGDSSVRLWDTFTWQRRLTAQQELEAVQPQAERLVGDLFKQTNDADTAASRLRADKTLSEPMKRAVWRALLRRITERPSQR